jgi:peptidoglycan/LPS O-acetylase OafA/YrhL
LTTLENKRPYFHNLNGLRFFAAIAVILFHSVSLHREMWGDFYNTPLFQKFVFIAYRGHMGIIFFFVLSGFLITYLLLWESKKNGGIKLLNYLMRRFLRVWPLYFLVVLFGFFIFPLLPYGIETKHELWRFMFFMSNIDEILIGAFDPINFLSATWTVSVEEQFYLVWGIFIGMFRFRKARTYYAFFIGIIGISLLFRYYHLDEPRTLYFHTLSVMSDVAFGGIFGLLAFDGKAQAFFENRSRFQIVIFYLIAAWFLIYEGHFINGPLFVFERFVPGLIFGVIILEQIYAKRSFFKADKIPFFSYSGRITYGFYMFHCIYLYYWSTLFSKWNFTEYFYQYVIYFVVVFVSTYFTAHLSFKYFETPFLKLKKYFR